MSTPAETEIDRSAAIQAHPLYPILVAAIEQAMYGKGERHGGAVTPFLEQPWVHYAKLHGRGFLTGQAAKKLEEAASLREGKTFETEVLGAIVYCGMAIVQERWNCGRISDSFMTGHPLPGKHFSQPHARD